MPIESTSDSKDSTAPKKLESKDKTIEKVEVKKDSVEDGDDKIENHSSTETIGKHKLKYTNYYTQPLDGPLYLSGTFGELRGNHFHAGLDIRTGGVEGKKVYAVASGYVSRIKVATNGYGKALYIQHPNGTTSVYGHLKKFEGAIQDAVIARQYSLEKYGFDWYVPAGKLKVTKGQVIALSGNTGGSGGPHLHFEIRDKRGKTANPLLYGIDVKDKLEPKIKGCRLYAINYKRKEDYGCYGSKKLSKSGTFEVKPGGYGLGVNWVDYFSDRLNRLGINYAELQVDGKTIFTQKIEDFAFDQGRYINNHIDYWHYAEHGVRYVKMYRDRGNPLHFYSGNGKITIEDGQRVEVSVIASDFSGKKARCSFVLIGKKDASDLTDGGNTVTGGKLCSPTSASKLSSANATVSIPRSALYHATHMQLTETAATGKAVSPMVRVNHSNTPLHKSATISIKIPEEAKANKEKLVMMSYNQKTRQSSYEGGKVSGNYVVETSKSLGMYYLTIDTVPPKVTSLSLKRFLSFRVVDLTSDIGDYRCTIDGKWVLLEYEPKANKLFGTIPKSHKAGNHELVLIVNDNAGNKIEIKKRITIQ